MRLQIIKSVDGKDEYALLPVSVYQALRAEIEEELLESQNDDYVPFNPADYVENPIALARIQAKKTQAELAALMGVSQAYISKIESLSKVTPKLLLRLKAALSHKERE
ncbi:MAG: helix-turn-helix domain-containing protein [Proteobacteria bacterium]|nr:helix-turn-helix domain-containing protein [Pseudomonadota bacterium]